MRYEVGLGEECSRALVVPFMAWSSECDDLLARYSGSLTSVSTKQVDGLSPVFHSRDGSLLVESGRDEAGVRLVFRTA